MLSCLGPFSQTLRRSQVVDFSLPVYIDYGIGFLSMDIKKDYSILIRTFDWRVWLGVLLVTPIFVAVLSLSDWFYNGQTEEWWYYMEFWLRPICFDSVKLLRPQDYLRVYCLTWVLGSFILSMAYQGTLFLPRMPIYFDCRVSQYIYSHVGFPNRKAN